MDKQTVIDVLNALIEWDCEQGWNEAPCWAEARKLRDKLVEGGDKD